MYKKIYYEFSNKCPMSDLHSWDFLEVLLLLYLKTSPEKRYIYGLDYLCYYSNMIELKCKTPDTLMLSQMLPFQGDLKKRTDDDIKAMATSLLNEGLKMPFAIWLNDGKCYILDGHCRKLALLYIALNDMTVTGQEFPVLLISAASEDEAKQTLLQISSSYGKINKTGLIEFTKTLVNYKAPIIKIPKTVIKSPKIEDDRILIKLRVEKDKAADLFKLLNEVKGVEVL